MFTLENAHALIIGIADYQHINPLPATVIKDAADISDLLADPNLCAYPPGNVRFLSNEQATRTAMRTALAELVKRTDADSTVFFYISSHGGRIENGDYAGEYLLPVDVENTSDRKLAETAISGDEFSEAISAIPARKLVVVFDCCHAAGIGQIKAVGAPELKTGLSESYYDRLKMGRGRVILASSRSTEYSYVLPGASNSLFTQHFLAGMRGDIASDDGLIRVFDLFEYVQPRVTGDYSQQHPVFKAEVESNFPIALRLAGQKSPPPTDEQGFLYDAYISYVDEEPDATWVWDELAPKLAAAGLNIAISEDVQQPGVARVVNTARGIEQARRTVMIVSPNFLGDHMAEFESTMAVTIGIQKGKYRTIPIYMAQFDESRLPSYFSRDMITPIDLTHGSENRVKREWDKLIRALKGPVPTM